MTTTYKILLPLFIILFSSNTFSDQNNAIGVWKTESSDEGYLHVSIEECENSLCGTIVKAYSLQDEINNEYEHLGKNMVWDMKIRDSSSWSGGKIWDPTNGKTYKSKMSVKDDILSVSGCVLFICKAQDWTRVP